MIDLKINRVWAMPNKWTFKIKPIKKLIDRYVKGGKGWIDPFAGKCSPAEFTNDLNSDMPTKFHLDAKDFCTTMKNNGLTFKGVLFDPPYTYGQICETYKRVGIERADLVNNNQLYAEVKDALMNLIEPNGFSLHFGFHSNGFGKGRGFKIIEILLIAHGGAHYDTIVTVEQKVQTVLK